MRELNTKAKRWKRSFVFQVWNNLAKSPKSRKMGLRFTKNKFLILQKKQLYLECFSYFFISTFVLLISKFFQSNPIYYFWQKTPSLVVHRVLKTPLGLTLKYWKSLEELIRINKNRLYTMSWAVTRETCNKLCTSCVFQPLSIIRDLRGKKMSSMSIRKTSLLKR